MLKNHSWIFPPRNDHCYNSGSYRRLCQGGHSSVRLYRIDYFVCSLVFLFCKENKEKREGTRDINVRIQALEAVLLKLIFCRNVCNRDPFISKSDV